MELKEFIEDTLMQIVEGVKSAQDRSKETGAIVSPYSAGGDTVNVENKRRTVVNVEFEVVLSESTVTEKGGKVSVAFFNVVGVDGGKNAGHENGVRTNVKFFIPIVLPGIENNNNRIHVTNRPVVGEASF